jgi:rhodanese-related sulfurtransferase
MEFITKNIFLVLIALVSGGMLLWPLVRRGAAGAGVSTLQATQLMNRSDALVVDLRPAADYAKGHILGATNIPATDLDKRMPELEKHKARPLIVHCADGGRSGTAAAALRRAGFGNVVSLSGGFGAWQQAGLPVEK